MQIYVNLFALKMIFVALNNYFALYHLVVSVSVTSSFSVANNSNPFGVNL